MGITIDIAILRVQHLSMSVDDKETADFIINTMRKYQQLKANYEDRLKADMVAMLTELQLEIEEEKLSTKHLHYNELEQAESYNSSNNDCIDLIQQKIDSLKAESEDNNR